MLPVLIWIDSGPLFQTYAIPTLTFKPNPNPNSGSSEEWADTFELSAADDLLQLKWQIFAYPRTGSSETPVAKSITCSRDDVYTCHVGCWSKKPVVLLRNAPPISNKTQRALDQLQVDNRYISPLTGLHGFMNSTTILHSLCLEIFVSVTEWAKSRLSYCGL